MFLMAGVCQRTFLALGMVAESVVDPEGSQALDNCFGSDLVHSTLDQSFLSVTPAYRLQTSCASFFQCVEIIMHLF